MTYLNGAAGKTSPPIRKAIFEIMGTAYHFRPRSPNHDNLQRATQGITQTANLRDILNCCLRRLAYLPKKHAQTLFKNCKNCGKLVIYSRRHDLLPPIVKTTKFRLTRTEQKHSQTRLSVFKTNLITKPNRQNSWVSMFADLSRLLSENHQSTGPKK